eukprot:TRINITY_DN27178_c0_g1_i1.p1 TRINITY_DN27178_c0_g1~~TRINITY_DN27178_c0_g1_i1.p1  ORF type:complete len:228 (-),score=47.14 TRINITY_DN27178_c0_g1_i1:209-892(-)
MTAVAAVPGEFESRLDRLENRMTSMESSWAGVRSMLQDLDTAIAHVASSSSAAPAVSSSAAAPAAGAPPPPAPAPPPVAAIARVPIHGRELAALGPEPSKRPSIWTSTHEADLERLGRHYTPNIFAWSASTEEGVEDDVSPLQLRIAARLSARQRQLDAAGLDTVKKLQEQEMYEADRFLQAFDVQTKLAMGFPDRLQSGSRAGPLPPAAPSAAYSEGCDASRACLV